MSSTNSRAKRHHPVSQIKKAAHHAKAGKVGPVAQIRVESGNGREDGRGVGEARGVRQAKPFTAPDGRVILSRGVLARQIGVNTSFLCQVLNGKKRLSFERGLRMAAVLGCSPVELWFHLYGEGGCVPRESAVRQKLLGTGVTVDTTINGVSHSRSPRHR